MEFMNKTILELHDDLINKKVTSEELIEESLAKSHKDQDKYNAFVTIVSDSTATDVTENLLSCISCIWIRILAKIIIKQKVFYQQVHQIL